MVLCCCAAFTTWFRATAGAALTAWFRATTLYCFRYLFGCTNGAAFTTWFRATTCAAFATWFRATTGTAFATCSVQLDSPGSPVPTTTATIAWGIASNTACSGHIIDQGIEDALIGILFQ